MKKMSAFMLILSISFLVAIIVSGCGNMASQTSAANSDGQKADGASLLESRCSVCHSADRAKAAKKSADAWTATVSRMISHGAVLSETEKKSLVEYLSAKYGQ